MDVSCYPEMSRDTNGLTKTIEIRWYLMQWETSPSHIVLKLHDGGFVRCFVERLHENTFFVEVFFVFYKRH